MFLSNGALAQVLMDDDDEIVSILMIQSMKQMFAVNKKRKFKWDHDRLNWQEHLEKERHQNSFESKYHMSKELCPAF
jgi:hypothetical protein